jgi:hypothetical protein
MGICVTGVEDARPYLDYLVILVRSCCSDSQIRIAVNRKKTPNSLRFEVFKRDKFTCQYCGRKAPEVILQADHLQPVSKGGGDDILNLITCCVECNSGKSNKTLSESILLDKTRAQLEELEERRQQLEMMVRWKESLAGANDRLVNAVSKQLGDASGFVMNNEDITKIRRLVREFGYDEVSEAVSIAADQYFRRENGKVTQSSLDVAIGKLGGICKRRRLKQTNPEEDDLYFALNIWKKAAGSEHSIVNSRAMDAIRAAHGRGVPLNRIKQICSTASWITRLEQELESETSNQEL